jgi:hypothetical protein
MADHGHNPQLDQMMAEAVKKRDDLLAHKAAGREFFGGDRTLDQEIEYAKNTIVQIEMMMAQSKIDRSKA